MRNVVLRALLFRSKYTIHQNSQQIRKIFAIILISLFIVTGCITQSTTKHKVGVVNLTPMLDPVYEGFRNGLQEMGYIEHENIEYVYHEATGSIEFLDQAVDDLLAQNIDLILAISTPAAQAAQGATLDNEIPVVFVPIFDPVAAGLVDSLQQPGKNLTGVHWGIAEARRLEWLIKIAPETKRIYIPYNPNDQSPVLALAKVQEAADLLGVELITREARTADEIEYATRHVPENIDAILLLPDSLVASRHATLLQTAIEHKLPYSVPASELAEQGGLISFGHMSIVSGHIAARIAAQILEGVPVADLPVETAEFFLAINIQTAEAIGLEISNEILSQADIIIR
ncbi:ABC transporter substrate-binding protein [Chloroflexi bacterium TSY]|nr:ABC transporter substrate-binding protein [Chloroflexi bacterium TSY]